MSDPTGRTGFRDSSRGQLLIIVGLLLASTFVALALVVNSGIYTENLATRENTDAETLQIEQAAVDDGVLEAVDMANANVRTNSWSEILTEFEASLDTYNSSLSDKYGAKGRYIDVRKTGDQQGVRIRQTNASRNMTSRHGDWNWTMTDGYVEESGHFTMNLNNSSLYEVTLDTTMAALAKSAFGVEFELESYGGTGDGVWRVYFFEGAATDNIYAIVEKPNQTFENNQTAAIEEGYLSQACAVQADSVSVRLAQSTYGGRYCEEFDFYGSGAIDSHSIRYVNAVSNSDPLDLLNDTNESERALGGYDIMLGASAPNTSAVHDVGGGQPWHQAAIYRIGYRLVYESPDTDFTADRVVHPTNSTTGGLLRQHPNVDEFDVTDRTSTLGDPTFDIDWAVSDVDGDLDRVELHLVHDPSGTDTNTETIVNETTVPVQGSHASGHTQLCDCEVFGAVGDDYRIQITVVDNSSRATTESEIQTAD